MNWILKTLNIGYKLKKIFKKRPSKEEIENSNWTSCCKGPILKTRLEENLWVCHDCGKHHRISAKQRLDITFGTGNYEIIKTPIPVDDPLEWVDAKSYKDRLKSARKKTGLDCAVLIAKAKLNEIEITVGAFDFNFIGGSVGQAEGEALISGIQNAIDNNQPFLLFTASGGMRMFESLIALSQMSRVTLAVNELKKKNLPYIVILTDPTAGGTTASFGMTGDITFAEPGALVAFAGKRVIQGTVKEELPSDFQTSEYLEKKCGFIDSVIERKDLKKKIGSILSILLKKNSEVHSNLNETSENDNKAREAS